MRHNSEFSDETMHFVTIITLLVVGHSEIFCSYDRSHSTTTEIAYRVRVIKITLTRLGGGDRPYRPLGSAPVSLPSLKGGGKKL